MTPAPQVGLGENRHQPKTRWKTRRVRELFLKVTRLCVGRNVEPLLHLVLGGDNYTWP